MLGLGAGAALGFTPQLLAPTGLSAGDASATAPMPSPEYETNANGQTFGSAALSNSPESEPDLILVEATNGKTGYVLKTELDDANGTTAAKGFKSPEDALAWQAGEGSKDHVISVYAEDGMTVVGEFVIVGAATQAEESTGIED